jgi:glycosyltransferase involved in cell wall biosynthesis
LRLVMLFGRRDQPTDAVRDYANCLAAALRPHSVSCETWGAEWHQQGWFTALANLWRESRAWRARWVVLHYTALMWSRRGFPLPALLVLAILIIHRCRKVVVFHDGYPAAGPRWIDPFRTSVQKLVIHQLSRRSDRAILPVPLESAYWFPALRDSRVRFIPVGANIPSLDDLARDGFVPSPRTIPTVAVFGVPTWPSAQQREVHAIVQTLRSAVAKVGDLQLLVLGRGAKEAEPLVRAGLSGTGISIRVDGVKSSREISEALSSSDVLLFVRGSLSSRRGSGLAGLACGLPIVAYKGRETGFPLTDAGIIFVPQDDLHALADELCRVLLNPKLRSDLSARNLAAFRKWFSWDQIALQWVQALRDGADSGAQDRVSG